MKYLIEQSRQKFKELGVTEKRELIKFIGQMLCCSGPAMS